jgi:hypothetical protein
VPWKAFFNIKKGSVMKCTNHEDLVLRSSYMIKTTNKNVDAKILEYKDIIQITAKICYNNMYQTMDRIGYDLDDIISLSSLYAYYFFNIYADNVAQKTKNGERNALITFIRQRLWYLLKVAGTQSKNFHPHNWVGGYFAKTKDSIYIEEDMQNVDPTFFGYRKVTHKEFEDAKKSRSGAKVLDKNGFEIIKLGYLNVMTDSEYACILHDGMDMAKSVEEQIVARQYDEQQEEFKEIMDNFFGKTKEERIEFLNNYIKNTTDAVKKEQAKALRKLIKRNVNG